LFYGEYQNLEKEKFMKYFYIVASFLLVTGCASGDQAIHEHDAFTQHYENSLFQVSKNRVYSVEMVIKEHELKTGANQVDIIVHDKNDHDVVGAAISVTPWMPTMGHGVLVKPVMTEKGAGLYSVDNIVFSMGGLWELRVEIDKDNVKDTAVFNFPDVKIDRGHDHKMTSIPADIDLTENKMTDKKLFRISYKSNLYPIPINQFHAWNLVINTADGRPISGANISLDGDMPEHGHGLPTHPEVTEDFGNGEYTDEGLKFSMPGWWIMKITIKTDDEEDVAAFNLMLKE
jgi:hypothetical protein